MQSILTSWKEIAQYMGKGVRTVQRWEECFGLPVRRLNTNSHHAVLAVPEEIDAWVRIKTEIQTKGMSGSEAERLRNRIVELEEQNRFLRRRLGLSAEEDSGNFEDKKPGIQCGKTRLLQSRSIR
jgi:hypothetical protein